MLLLLVVGVDCIVFLVFFFTVTSPSLTHLPVRLAVPSTGKKTCERIANKGDPDSLEDVFEVIQTERAKL